MKTALLKTIKPTLLLLTVLLSVLSCDKDFVNVESDIRGQQNFNTSSKVFPFKAYNKKIQSIQTNALPVNLLGIYNDPNYGSTAASIVTQVVPTDLSPDFGETPEIISVKLYIPYFSTLTETDTDGNSSYTLDSIFGDTNEPYKLTIFRNNFYLRTLDPGSDFEETQAYYSDTYNSSNTSSFEGDIIYLDDNFLPNSEEIKIEENEIGGTTLEEIEDRRSPGIYLDLTTNQTQLDYWKNVLIDGNDMANLELSDSDLFKDTFRGLTFKVEALDPVSNEGNMTMLNLDNAKIDVRYEKGVTDERERADYTLNFNGIKFNRLENLSNFLVLNDGDPNSGGDNQLFLKGFEGSMTVIELFNGTVLDENNAPQDAFQYFKDKEEKWLINEANLTFYVDLDPMVNVAAKEPDRIILYDLENNRPILDFFFDTTEDLTNPLNSKIIHAPALEREVVSSGIGSGIKYKFRLTQHINQILKEGVDNIKLGLYVSTNVNLTTTSKLENANENDTVNFEPQTSVIAPRGTILHGNTSSVQEDVKATFEIFYTESQN